MGQRKKPKRKLKNDFFYLNAKRGVSNNVADLKTDGSQKHAEWEKRNTQEYILCDSVLWSSKYARLMGTEIRIVIGYGGAGVEVVVERSPGKRFKNFFLFLRIMTVFIILTDMFFI